MASPYLSQANCLSHTPTSHPQPPQPQLTLSTAALTTSTSHAVPPLASKPATSPSSPPFFTTSPWMASQASWTGTGGSPHHPSCGPGGPNHFDRCNHTHLHAPRKSAKSTVARSGATVIQTDSDSTYTFRKAQHLVPGPSPPRIGTPYSTVFWRSSAHHPCQLNKFKGGKPNGTTIGPIA